MVDLKRIIMKLSKFEENIKKGKIYSRKDLGF